MGQKAHLLGQRFGQLTVIAEESRGQAYPAWLCKCDCGKHVVKRGKDLLRTQRRGWVDSCGCQQQFVRSIVNQFRNDDRHLQAMHAKRRQRPDASR